MSRLECCIPVAADVERAANVAADLDVYEGLKVARDVEIPGEIVRDYEITTKPVVKRNVPVDEPAGGAIANENAVKDTPVASIRPLRLPAMSIVPLD